MSHILGHTRTIRQFDMKGPDATLQQDIFQRVWSDERSVTHAVNSAPDLRTFVRASLDAQQNNAKTRDAPNLTTDSLSKGAISRSTAFSKAVTDGMPALFIHVARQ